MHILLIQGGWSTERKVSLAGSRVIKASLEKLGHKVSTFDPALEEMCGLPEMLSGVDFAFIGLHGTLGEDGLIQAFLERFGVPYQGSRSGASALALDKNLAKSLFRAAGLPTAPSVLLTQKPEASWRPPFSCPVFIKSNNGGSSLKMEFVRSFEDLEPAYERLFIGDASFLMEQAVFGQELTCGVLARLEGGEEYPEALPPILIKAKGNNGFFDYQSKYTVGGAEEICPAPISQELTAKVQEFALKAHAALGLSGYSRSDFIWTQDDKLVLLETNTLPGMAETSLIPQEAAAIGLSFEGLLERLIELGFAQAGQEWKG